MRVFAAVVLPEEIKNNLSSFIENGKKVLPHLKWLNKNSFHITLKFIAHIDRDDLAGLIKSVEMLADFVPVTELKISGVGVFPSLKAPRVLWAGIKVGAGTVKDMAANIDNNLPAKIKKETREIIPHITLARVAPLDKASAQSIREYCELNSNFEFGSFFADKISVFESILTSAGALHKELCSFKLK